MLSILFLGSCFRSYNAQGIRVSGKITDAADGSSLVGVTIQEKGPLTGLTRMAMVTSASQLLQMGHWVISYIGYASQEVVVNGRTVINIVMAVANLKLNEVVVIGYGTVKNQNATGSIVAGQFQRFHQGAIPRLRIY